MRRLLYVTFLPARVPARARTRSDTENEPSQPLTLTGANNAPFITVPSLRRRLTSRRTFDVKLIH